MQVAPRCGLNADFPATDNGISFAHPKHGDENSETSRDAANERCLWQSFILARRLLFCPPVCFSGLVPQAISGISNSGKTWNSSNKISKSTSSGASREQNQLQQQLNDIPHQPGEPVERQQQLDDLQQQLEQRQLEQQQNQLRQEQQLDQLREEEQLNQPQRAQQFDQLQSQQQLDQLQQQQQIDQLREQQQKIR